MERRRGELMARGVAIPPSAFMRCCRVGEPWGNPLGEPLGACPPPRGTPTTGGEACRGRSGDSGSGVVERDLPSSLGETERVRCREKGGEQTD